MAGSHGVELDPVIAFLAGILRRVLVADLAVIDRFDEAGEFGQFDVVARARLAVFGDARNAAEVQVIARRDIGERLAARARVLDRVLDVVDLFAGHLDFERLTDLVLHFREGAVLAGGDLADMDDRPAERTLDRLAPGAAFEREGGVGEFRRDHLAARYVAEVDVVDGETQISDNGFDLAAAAKGLKRRAGGFFRREGDLLDLAPFRHVVLAPALFISLAQRLVGDRDALGDVLGLDLHEAEVARFGQGESGSARLVEGLDGFLVRVLDVADQRRRQDNVAGGARFLLEAQHDVDHGFGGRYPGGDRIGELTTHHALAALLDEAFLGNAVLPEQLAKELTVETAECALQVRIGQSSVMLSPTVRPRLMARREPTRRR